MKTIDTQERLFVHIKTCSRCNKEKDIIEFAHDAGRKDGYKYWCKECMNEYGKIYYQNNKERKAQKCREYRNKNKDRINAYVREYRAKNANKTFIKQQRDYIKTRDARHEHYELRKQLIRDRNMVKKYGINMAQRNEIITSQNYRCAICGELLNNDRRTHIDHDHKTGKVRGVLCTYCNTGIGMFKDNTDKLRKAILYLEGN